MYGFRELIKLKYPLLFSRNDGTEQVCSAHTRVHIINLIGNGKYSVVNDRGESQLDFVKDLSHYRWPADNNDKVYV